MIVLGDTPVLPGVAFVVQLAFFVLLLQTLARAGWLFSVFFDNPLGAGPHVSMNIDVQAVVVILQDVICAPADNHAIALFGNLSNHLVLCGPQVVIVGQPTCHGIHPSNGKCIRQPTLDRGIFALLFNIFLVKSGLFGHLFDEFPVIEIVPQPLRHKPADCSASAAEFTTDCDDVFLHRASPPNPW